MLKGGDSGNAAAVPGQSDKSLMIRYVNGTAADLGMPLKGDRHRYQPLSVKEIQLLRYWIDLNAVWPKQLSQRSGDRPRGWLQPEEEKRSR